MPVTIHTAWLPSEEAVPSGRLFFWAESQIGTPPASLAVETTNGVNGSGGANHDNKHVESNGRRGKVPSHPFQMPVGQLRQLVRHLYHGNAGGGHPTNATVWLPSQLGQPQSRTGSYQRGVSTLNGSSNIPTQLLPWQVTGLSLDPFDALIFLSQMGSQRLLDSAAPTSMLRHARLGNDLVFWSHVAKYVLATLAGQHFLPSVKTDPSGHFTAVWQPSLLDPDLRRRLEVLVEAMPPICRAYNISALSEAPVPAALVEHFVATLVDRTIRNWIQHDSKSTSPAAGWLQSLLTDRTRLHLPPQPAHQLYHSWVAWVEQLHTTSSDANFRLAFVLREPEPGLQNDAESDQGRWTLEYFLQARDSLDLMVPARQVWQEQSHTLRIDGRRFDQPQERLLAGLGVASRLCAPIKESLRSPRPEMAILSTQQAHEFLREVGPLLESSGFGVVLPLWWLGRQRARLNLRLRLQGQGGSTASATQRGQNGRHPGADASLEKDNNATSLTLNSLIRFHWDLALGEHTLSQDEFEQLVAINSPLVNIRGQWVELEAAQVAAARRFLEKHQAAGSMSLLQAVRMAQSYARGTEQTQPQPNAEWLSVLDLEPSIRDELPLDSVEVEGWLDEVLERLRSHDQAEEMEEPQGFKGTLRPYQKRGLGWLHYLRNIGLGACLADDMGLGKTVQAIALLLHTRNEAATRNQRLNPSLLICPTSVVSNWRHEMERFAPGLRPLIHHGSGRLEGDDFFAALAEHDLIITSYGTARRDIEMLKDFRWSDVILDEAQNIKNPGAKQTQAVRRIQSDNRLALTGTPVENRLLELWSIMEFLNPGYLGSRERFRQQYVLPIERYNDETSAAELRRLVQPFLLRRLKTDPTIITDLPEKNEMIVYCPLHKEQAALYNQVVQETMDRVEQSEGIQRRGLVLSLLLKLKQVCNHPAHYLRESAPLVGRSGKLNRLTEMLDEALSVGDRALVFTQFVEMGHLIQAHLQETFGTEVLFLHGGTPALKRDEMVQLFQREDSGPPIFVLSLRAGGVGLNLTRANHVFHFDRWWNPAVENQATDRAFRIGQQRSVQVYKFVVAGTLEERIHDLIENKKSLAESIVGSGEDWLADIDTDELRRILSLRRDEVEEEVVG